MFDIDKKHLSEINKLYSKYDPSIKERCLMKAFILNGLAKRDDTLYMMICDELKNMGWEVKDFYSQDKKLYFA